MIKADLPSDNEMYIITQFYLMRQEDLFSFKVLLCKFACYVNFSQGH